MAFGAANPLAKGKPNMNTAIEVFEQIRTLFNISAGEFLGITLTSGKLVGYLGVALFSGRWLIQMGASGLSGKPVLPRVFWYMSAAGSLCLLGYFVFAKNDSVGVLSNLFPLAVALYNLSLERSHRRKMAV
jgi:lipid-A-disaccharide synthase-like uncharacterized protein